MEIEIKTSIDITLYLLEWLPSINQQTRIFGEDVEEREP